MQSLSRPLLNWLESLDLFPNCDLSLNLTAPRNNQDFYETLKQSFIYFGEGRKFCRAIRDHFPYLHRQSSLDWINVAAVFAALHRHDLTILPKENGDEYTDHIITMHFYRFWSINPKLEGSHHTLRSLLREDVMAPPPQHLNRSTKECSENKDVTLARLWHDAEHSANSGKMNYVKRRIRLHLEASQLRGKDPARALAALRAWKTRIQKGALA